MMTCKSMLGSCGLMDKASDFGSEDCRFESCHDRKSFFLPFRAIKKEAYLSQRSYQRNGRKKKVSNFPYCTTFCPKAMQEKKNKNKI